MKKILFLHGFFASGQCVPALTLRESFEGRAEVVMPDLPMHPKEAIEFIREMIDREEPDLLIGNHFPGGHTPTADEVRTWYVPLAEKMPKEYPLPEA